MKNYYAILELPSFEENQEVILSAYRRCTKLRESQYEQSEVKEELILINESYLVLSDTSLKKRYDYALNTSQTDAELEGMLLQKHAKAKEFIGVALAHVPKQKKSLWISVLCSLFLLSGIGTIANKCAPKDTVTLESFENVGRYYPDSDWTEYEIAGAFTLSVPNTMELRSENDSYTKHLNSLGFPAGIYDAIFQQKNLSLRFSAAYDTYCRILVQHFHCTPGEVGRYNQTSPITQEDKNFLKEVIDGEVSPYQYEELPIFRWIDIGETKVIDATYKRSGDKGLVRCRLYILQNYNEMVKMVVAYRECDAGLWEDDLENVIRTFKWNSPQ